jgi:hypothetical protein
MKSPKAREAGPRKVQMQTPTHSTAHQTQTLTKTLIGGNQISNTATAAS